MNIAEFKDRAFSEAIKKGCAAAEIYFSEGDSFNVDVLEGDLNEYQVSKQFGVNLRVKLNGKDGYAYTETLDNPEALVLKAMDNAIVIETVDEHPMQGESEYVEVKREKSPLDSMSEKEKIDFCLEVERRIKATDSRVARVDGCAVMSETGRTCIYNTLGLSAEETYNVALSYVVPIMVQDGEHKMGMAFRSGKKALDMDEMIAEAIEETAIQFNASSVPVGKYDIILRNTTAASLLSAFSSMFSAEQAQKGLSLLANKEGTVIANELITIVDNPFHEEAPRAFDGEGVPSVITTVVENGELKTLLHNLKTAKKAGVQSTSNAGRSLTSPIGVSPSVFYIEPREIDYSDLLKKLNNGLVITSLAGLHSGVNPISGEFSLLASGLLIENGEVVRSVDQITLSGSFIELLSNVNAIGSDLKFDLSFGSIFGSPSLLIGSMQISGK
ncbi:MAG: TldD/PmbA family protein [Clostridia bacterium]|nr:TldD/PmbA family protein [Clostridia bacterium]